MVVTVASKVGQSVSQSLGGLGLAGGSMLLRLRRTSIAMLAVVGAMGLGLVVFISQLGWPAVLSGPLPGAPAKVESVHPGVALTRPAPLLAPGSPAVGRRNAAARRARQGGVGADRQAGGKTGVGGSRGANSAGGSQPGSGTGSGEPVSQPASQPAPIVSPPASSTPGSVNSGSSSAAGNAKAANDGARSTSIASSKSSGGPQTAGSPSGSSKSGEQATTKASSDSAAAATTPPPAANPAPPPSASPAAGKEAADTAR